MSKLLLSFIKSIRPKTPISRLSLVISALGLCLLMRPNSVGAVAPEIQWQSLTTNHFEIIFENHQKLLAEEVARSAERAHILISPFLGETSGRTIIWINDHSDAPNGLATVFPRNLIILYPVLPSSLDSISHYDNWSQKLVTHEYTHILNMDPASGIWSAVRFVFGSIIRPNALLPNWYVEGLAVEFETQFTKNGRLRSPYFNALIRALVADNRWYEEPLSLINEVSIPTWPYGLRPYFWGSLLMNEITLKKNLETFSILNSRYSGRVPFFLAGPLHDLLGMGYQELLTDMRHTYEKRATLQLNELRSQSLKPVLWRDVDAEIHSPSLSSDGLKLAFVRVNDDKDSEIHIITRKKIGDEFKASRAQRVWSGTEIGRLEFGPDSKKLLFDQLNTKHIYDAYSDLHVLDFSIIDEEVKVSSSKAITYLERAQEGSFAANSSIVYVKSSAYQTRLALWKNGQTKIIFTPPLQHRISRPSFWTDDEIIFSERLLSGKEIIKVFKISDGRVRQVLEDFDSVQNLKVHERGLLFVSNKSGVPNLYWAGRTLTGARAISNSETAISMGVVDLSREEVIFAQLTGKGHRLFSQDIPLNAIKLAPQSPLVNIKASDFKEPEIRTPMEIEEYSPMSYLLPQYWLPLFGSIEDGWAVTAITGAQDPLKKHSYFLNLNYDSLTAKLGFIGKYDYSMGDGLLTAAGGIDHVYYYGYNLTSTTTSTDLQYSFYPNRSSNHWILGLRISRNTSEIPNVRFYDYTGPGAMITYSDVTQKPTQISPRSGLGVSVDHQHFIGSLGQIDFPRSRASLDTFFPSFFKRHALALSMDGYFSPRNRSVFLGTTAGGDFGLSYLSTNTMSVRGYPISEFIGWKVMTGSLEYRFPLIDRASNLSTFPVMFKRWHAGLFLDAVTLEGFYYSKDLPGARSTDTGIFFYGTGLEIRSDLTLAYHLPAVLRIGLFYGVNENAYGGFSPFLALSVPQF